MLVNNQPFFISIAEETLYLTFSGFTKITYTNIQKRFKNFIVSPSAKYYQIDFKAKQDDVPENTVEINPAKQYWDVVGNGMRGSILSDSALAEVFPDDHVVDSFIRIVYSKILIDQHAMLIHASALSGAIYTGPSGSGKTTSIKANPEMLGDDLVVLKQKNKKWMIFSTPFTGEFEGLVNQKKERLNKIYLMSFEQATINPSDLYKELLKNIVYFFPDKKGLEKIMQYCETIAFNIPAYGYHKPELLKVKTC